MLRKIFSAFLPCGMKNVSIYQSAKFEIKHQKRDLSCIHLKLWMIRIGPINVMDFVSHHRKYFFVLWFSQKIFVLLVCPLHKCIFSRSTLHGISEWLTASYFAWGLRFINLGKKLYHLKHPTSASCREPVVCFTWISD